MENKPLISVVIPIYQVEKYLPTCINSILNQTYSNLEIILVDDGSPDNCPAICDEFALKDSRIKVIHQKNGGLSSARNTGIEIAQGEYIGFIDSDDFIAPNFYEYLLNNALTHHADISECGFIKVAEDNMNSFTFPPIDNAIVSVTNNIGALERLFSEDFNTYVNTVVVWNKLYKRSLFQSIRYPLNKISEDEFTTYKLLYGVHQFVTSSALLHAYVQRSSSIMGKTFSSKRFDLFDAYEEAISFFDKFSLFDIELKCMGRYLETIIEFIEKAYKVSSNETTYMLKILETKYNLLYPRIKNFIKLYPEFNDKNLYFSNLSYQYENLMHTSFYNQ